MYFCCGVGDSGAGGVLGTERKTSTICFTVFTAFRSREPICVRTVSFCFIFISFLISIFFKFSWTFLTLLKF